MKNRILVLNEKNGNRYFYVPTDEDLERAALKIVLERNEDGYWYDERDKQILDRILTNKNGKLALRFLKSRDNFEYEGVEVEECENF